MNPTLQSSINFVPPDQRKEIRRSFGYIIAKKFAFALCCIIIVFSISLLGIKIFFENRLKKLDDEYAQNAQLINSKNTVDVSQAIIDLNQMTTKISSLQKDFVYWSWSIAGFSELVPTGITINSMTISYASKKATVNGVADTRASYTTFKSNVTGSKIISNAEFPISLEKTNIAFSVTMTLTDTFFKHE